LLKKSSRFITDSSAGSMLSKEKRLGVRLYRLSNDATKSPSKKNWKAMSYPSLLKNRRRQPFRIKNNLSAILPSSSNIVLGGTDNSVISGRDKK